MYIYIYIYAHIYYIYTYTGLTSQPTCCQKCKMGQGPMPGPRAKPALPPPPLPPPKKAAISPT